MVQSAKMSSDPGGFATWLPNRLTKGVVPCPLWGYATTPYPSIDSCSRTRHSSPIKNPCIEPDALTNICYLAQMSGKTIFGSKKDQSLIGVRTKRTTPESATEMLLYLETSCFIHNTLLNQMTLQCHCTVWVITLTKCALAGGECIPSIPNSVSAPDCDAIKCLQVKFTWFRYA